jgi:hypothetical protein
MRQVAKDAKNCKTAQQTRKRIHGCHNQCVSEKLKIQASIHLKLSFKLPVNVVLKFVER